MKHNLCKFILLSLLSWKVSCYEIDGFFVDIPDDWKNVYVQIDGITGLKTIGKKGNKNEQFIVNFFKNPLTEELLNERIKFLRESNVGVREQQGLTVILNEEGLKMDGGFLDKIISFHELEKYTACEYRLYKGNRAANFVLTLEQDVESATKVCDKISDSIKWLK